MTVKNVAEAKAFFGLPQDAPVVEITLFAVDESLIDWDARSTPIHLRKQAC
jgi:hypothetical protein